MVATSRQQELRLTTSARSPVTESANAFDEVGAAGLVDAIHGAEEAALGSSAAVLGKVVCSSIELLGMVGVA